MAASGVEVALEPIRQVGGFVQACLIDSSSGMVLGSLQAEDRMNVAVAAAGAADIVNVLLLMTAELALKDELEDMIVTLTSHYHLIRVLPSGPAGHLILLVTLDRPQANLAMAHREIRDLNISIP